MVLNFNESESRIEGQGNTEHNIGIINADIADMNYRLIRLHVEEIFIFPACEVGRVSGNRERIKLDADSVVHTWNEEELVNLYRIFRLVDSPSLVVETSWQVNNEEKSPSGCHFV